MDGRNLRLIKNQIKFFIQKIYREKSTNVFLPSIMSLQETCDKFCLPKRFRGDTRRAWREFIQLTVDCKPLCLGNGYADYSESKYFTDVLAAVSKDPNNMLTQYTRGFGHVRLVAALSKLYSRAVGREIDPLKEILVTCGGYEAICCSILGHIEEADEVIVIEPVFSIYLHDVKMAGGIIRYVPLRLNKDWNDGDLSSSEFSIDEVELESSFNEKTKMIIINTPNNPSGKVFNKEELTKIAELCVKYNVMCLADEVYEWTVFDNKEHVRICTLPAMWERTITVGSASKTFSLTGWRIGWAYGSEKLLANAKLFHHNLIYTCPTPLQEALAIIFENELGRFDAPDTFFKTMPADLQKKRDILANGLRSVGMKVIIPEGGFFLVADFSNLVHKTDLDSEPIEETDYKFAKWMVRNIGLVAYPTSIFFNTSNRPIMNHCLRICFFRKDEVLRQAIDMLDNWFNKT